MVVTITVFFGIVQEICFYNEKQTIINGMKKQTER